MGGSGSKDVAGKPAVAVVGGGFGGIVAAQQLDKNADFNVVLFDAKGYFLHNIGGLRAVVEPSFGKELLIPFDRLLKYGTVVKAEVAEIAADHLIVSGHAAPLKFDYCVIATGSHYAFPGKLHATSIAEALSLYEAANRVLVGAQNIVIIGGGPVGVELAGEICTDYPEKKVTLIHAGDVLVSDSALRDEFKVKALEQLQGLGCNVVLNERVVLEEEDSKAIREGRVSYLVGPTTVRTAQGKSFQADLVYICTGIKTNTTAVRKNFADKLNEQGRLRVNSNLQVEGLRNVFAIGDCAAIDQAMAFLAAEQAKIAAKNIRALQRGHAMKEYQPSKPLMSMSIGRRGGVSEFGGWVLGSTVTSMLKSRDTFAAMQWGRLNCSHEPEKAHEAVTKGQRSFLPPFSRQVRGLCSAFHLSEEDARRILGDGARGQDGEEGEEGKQ